MSPDLEKLRKKVKHDLDKERYQHTLGVMYTAASLAMCHNADLHKAMVAGLLHDCAKCVPNSEKMKLCKQYGLKLTKAEKDNPSLVHAKLGAAIAADKYGIKDQDILNAISSHTTGRPGMSLLEKIIYIADFIEPNREELPSMPDLRYLAFHDINQCLYRMLGNSLIYLNSKEAMIDPMTEQTYQYYKGNNPKE